MSRKSTKAQLVKEQPVQEDTVESEYEESDIENEIESDIEDEDPEGNVDQVDDDDSADKEDKDDDDDDDDDDGDDDEERSYKKKIAHRQRMIDNREISIVPADERITSAYMTSYEYAMVIGTRASHISNGAPIYIDATGLSEARDIAIREIAMKRCPLSISRKIGPHKVEIWEVNELTQRS
jgi:DNA-directed RNA polymerase I, II, and III subunit RPABC2